jgi:hypothetical protein
LYKYKECVLRYSDESFASIQSDERDDWVAQHVNIYVDDMVRMNNTRWKMMNQLITQAATSPQRFAIANGSEPYNVLTGVYGPTG